MTRVKNDRENWMRALRPFFPRGKFREDVEQRGPVEVLAARAGMGKAEPYAWLAGRAVPRAAGFVTFLTANNFPLDDYRDYLERATPTFPAICSARRSTKCRREWTMTRRQLGALNKRRRQRNLGPLAPEAGRISTPCAACVRAEVGRRALGTENDDRFAGFERDERPGIVADEMGGPGILEQNWKRFRTMVRKPKSASHRALIALAHVAAALVKGFRFCHLCELAVHEQHLGKRVCDRPHFHRVCLVAFRRWFSKTKGRQAAAHELPGPPHVGRRGPNPELRLLRNYKLLMAWARGDPAAVRAIREKEDFDSRGTAIEARKTFLRYSAGSWDLMFSKTKRIRAANSSRQELVPLPKSLERELKSGSRDALIVRLWAFAMPLDDIAAVIGADPDRIAGVTRDLTSDDLEGARKEVLDRCNPTPSVAPDRRALPTSSSRVHRAPINLKLTQDQAQDIVDAPPERGVNARKAREYGLSPGYVSAIRKGRTVWTQSQPAL